MLPRNLQCVLFSATFPQDVLQFAHKFSPGANEITLQVKELTVEGIKQLYLDCDSEAQKYDVLVKFYGLMTIASSIIFVRVSSSLRPASASIDDPDRLARPLSRSKSA
jgi:ATP-dependent RNA helicase DDX19/DBP5